MEIVTQKYVVNYLCSPIMIVNADTLEKAMEKFDKTIVIEAGEGVIKSDNKYIEFCLVNEIE